MDPENKLPEGVVELTDEQAKEAVGGLFDTFNDMKYFDLNEPVQFIYNVGDIVQVARFGGLGTVECKITALQDAETYETQPVSSQHTHYIPRHCDQYYCVQTNPPHCGFSDGWKNRSDIEA